MFEIDKERFGAFLLELRKEKGYTQKQLAEKLFVSDKAVSKWERGLSLPDITLLGPLAEILGVTVTELLQAQRISEEKTLTKPEVDALVSGSLRLSAEEQEEKRLKQRKNMIRYLLCMALAGVEIWLLLYAEVGKEIFFTGFFTIEGLSFLFGAWFCCLQERLCRPSMMRIRLIITVRDRFGFILQGYILITETGPMSCELDGYLCWELLL